MFVSTDQVHAGGPSAAGALAFNADRPAASRPHISGGGTPIIDVRQTASWWRRFALSTGLVRRPRVHQGDEVGDEENPIPSTAMRSSDLPSEDELLDLSIEFNKEEQRTIDPNLKAAFFALQKAMLETKNFDKMPEAKKLLLAMHNVKQEDLDRGFERGGAVYAYRNFAGSMLAFLPLILTYVRTQPENLKNVAYQVKMAAGYFASVLLASCAGVACNARVLVHCTPIQDAEFDGSPYIADELDSRKTPSNPIIKNELEACLKDLHDTTKSELDKAKSKAEAVKHYLGRAQLHRVYIDGLQLQSMFQTMKVFGNLAAGWVTFLEKNPRLGMQIQLGVGLGQMLAQRLVAPRDQKNLQNAMFELEIIARPLFEEPDYKHDQIIRGMLRTPREVRVLNIKNLMVMYVDELAQQIADILKITPAEYKKYRALVSKKKIKPPMRFCMNSLRRKRPNYLRKNAWEKWDMMPWWPHPFLKFRTLPAY